MFSKNKGFTLIELLIVIAILAVLATVTVVAINPAEIFRRTRDSQRLSDLDSIRTAINFYVVNTSSPAFGSASNSYSHVASTNCAGRTASTATGQAVNGTGWIPVNLTSLGGTPPLSNWPIDPAPTAVGANPGRYYVYLTNGTSTFEVIANMESSQYSQGGSNDVESKDGGNIPGLYEVGTEFILATTSTSCFAGTGN